MNKRKNQNGITLIALIITIIVLLILAVVAIRAVTGDGIIAHAKNARDEYERTSEEETQTMQNYADYIAGSIGNGQGGSTVQTKLHLGGVYKSTAIANESGSVHVFISCNAEGTAYMGLDVFNGGTGLTNWCQKNENCISYNKADKMTLSMGEGQEVDIAIEEEGSSFVVPAAVLNALNGSEMTSTDVTFTYTGETFAEHEPYKNKKYIIKVYLSGENNYFIFNDDGSITIHYENYPELSGTFSDTPIEGENGGAFTVAGFSLDGKIYNYQDTRNGLGHLDGDAVLEGSY